MATTVCVTERHIGGGRQNSDMWCPVALALLEAGYPEGMVHDRWMSLNEGGGEIETPPSVLRRVRKYDRTGEMEPFSFTLDIDPIKSDTDTRATADQHESAR